MSTNTDTAIKHLADARAALFAETGDADTLKQMDALEGIQTLINEAEVKVREYE